VVEAKYVIQKHLTQDRGAALHTTIIKQRKK